MSWIAILLANAPSSATYHQQQTQGWPSDDGDSWLKTPSVVAQGLSFVASGSYGLRKVEVGLLKVGTVTMDLTAEIWSSTGLPHVPNAKIGSSSAAINAAGVSTVSETVLGFVFPSDISLASGTRYWVVIRGASAGDASNYLYLDYKDTGGDDIAQLQDATWVNTGAGVLISALTAYTYS